MSADFAGISGRPFGDRAGKARPESARRYPLRHRYDEQPKNRGTNLCYNLLRRVIHLLVRDRLIAERVSADKVPS
jgi:hypothetical protein